MQKEVISGGHTPEPVRRVCFFPLPYPCEIPIDASGDLPMRRKGPSTGDGPSPPCGPPRRVLSLESNGECPLARTVGVDDRAGELVVRAA
jgi:hypothetical protein